MAELETADGTPALTKAEQKKKDEELTPAELLAFGILPQLEKPKLVKSPEPENPDEEAASSSSGKDGSK